MNSKIITVILAIALIVLGGLFFSQGAGRKADKVLWKTEKAERDDKIKTLEGKVVFQIEEADFWKGVADKNVEKSIKLEKELEKERAVHVVKVEAIAELPPTELTEETRRVIKASVEEVWQNELGLQFTLSGAQKNLTVLYIAEFSLSTEIPNLKATLKFKDDAIIAMRVAFDKDREGLLISHNGVTTELKKQITDDTKYIKKLNRKLTFAKWKNLAIGVGATLIVIKLFDLVGD